MAVVCVSSWPGNYRRPGTVQVLGGLPTEAGVVSSHRVSTGIVSSSCRSAPSPDHATYTLQPPRQTANQFTTSHLSYNKMPILTRECLAQRLRQNWLSKQSADPVCTSALDDSLTSLSWLQNLNIMKMAAPQCPTPAPAMFPNIMNDVEVRVNPNAVLNMNSSNVRVESAMTSPPASVLRPLGGLDIQSPLAQPGSMERLDYKTNPFVKPPYSYATLICMAMKESKKNKITLAGIYNWITDNFMYYRVADPSWQNSIRHNLSLNKCFQKVPRRKDEPGKGGFWRINPEYSDMFVNGIFKKRRSSTRENVAPPPSAKRFRRDLEGDLGVDVKIEVNEDAAAVLSLQSEELPSVLTGPDFTWNAILPAELELDSVRVKLESEGPEDIMPPQNSVTPPPSDSSSEVSFDELFRTDICEPVDLSSGSALDLTVQGQTIQPPEWWGESMTRGTFLDPAMDPALDPTPSGLHTPLATSPIHEADFCHPWAENRQDLDEAIAHFDLELQDLFEDESLSNSPLLEES